MKKRFLLGIFFLLLFVQARPPHAHADNIALIARGVVRTLSAAFEIPKSMLEDSGRIMFPFGLVTGAVSGAMRTVVGTIMGGVDIARGAAPYAKYAIFFI